MAKKNDLKRERRTANRYFVKIPIVWENMVEQNAGTLSDISLTGCFVLCKGMVSKGESVRLILTNKKGKTMSLWSEVVNSWYEVGFAANFVEISDEEQHFLKDFIAHLDRLD